MKEYIGLIEAVDEKVAVLGEALKETRVVLGKKITAIEEMLIEKLDKAGEGLDNSVSKELKAYE